MITLTYDLSPTSAAGALINALFCAALTIGLVVMGFLVSPTTFGFAALTALLDGVFWAIFLRARRKERAR